MAKLELTVYTDLDTLAEDIRKHIVDGSASATLEDVSDCAAGGARCRVMVFEKYSLLGGNRLSMNVTLFQATPGTVYLSAITAGGSQAMFHKINTWGEENFLEQLREMFP